MEHAGVAGNVHDGRPQCAEAVVRGGVSDGVAGVVAEVGDNVKIVVDGEDGWGRRSGSEVALAAAQMPTIPPPKMPTLKHSPPRLLK